MIFKIVFWLFVATCIFGFVVVCKDHPRKQEDVNLGTDLATWIIYCALTVWLWFGIWG